MSARSLKQSDTLQGPANADVYYDVTLTSAGQAIAAPRPGVTTAGYRIRQDATGGRLPTWFSGISWISTTGIAVGVSALSVVVVTSDGAGGWFGSVVYGGTPAVLPNAAPSITGTTATTATATWAASPGATGYSVRVNGGATIDNGAALTYTATGLPFGTAGTIEVRAYNSNLTAGWASTAFTTPTPTPVVIRLTGNDASVTESGDGTNGWNYAFAATPFNKGAHGGTIGLAANTDGFVEYTIAGNTAGTISPIAFFNATASNTTANPNTINGVQLQTADLKYVSTQQSAANVSAITAVNGDRVRFGRTGLTYWTRYSRDSGATWTDLRSYTAASAVKVYLTVNGNVYTGQVNNVRAYNFA